MAKRKSKTVPAKNAAKKTRVSAVADSPMHDKTPYLILSGWEGANRSPLRGYVYMPGNNDTRRELDQMSDWEIRNRIHWLMANCGIARRIVWGQAELLGFLTPQPSTGLDDWDDLAFDSFMSKAGQPNIFDKRGRFDFFTAQVQVNAGRGKDGRVLGLLTETKSKTAAMAFYEAHQIQSGGAYGHYEEGILPDRFDRHLAYSVRDGKDSSVFTGVDARDAIYYGNWDAMGRLHGLPILAAAVPNLLDVVELRGMRKHAAKNHASMGVVVEQDNGPAIMLPTGELLGIGGVRTVETEEEVEVEVDDGNGGTKTEKQVQLVKKPVTREAITGSGLIPHLQPGQRVKIIADDRPTPNNLEFEKILIEDIIMASGLPPAVIYHIADLTGPGVRYTMEAVRRWILLKHRQQAQECQRFYAYFLAKEIKNGNLPAPVKGGVELPYWRMVHWIGQPDMTIDTGRDGNLSVVRLDSGLTTWGDEWAEMGKFGRRKIKERIWEFAEAKAECIKAGKHHQVEVTLGEVMPRFAQKFQQPQLLAA